jgi:hypothetical protein
MEIIRLSLEYLQSNRLLVTTDNNWRKPFWVAAEHVLAGSGRALRKAKGCSDRWTLVCMPIKGDVFGVT